MPHFHETGYGRRFFESQLPRLIEALETLARAADARDAGPAIGTDDERALLVHALLVIAANPAIRDAVRAVDPMALAQIDDALVAEAHRDAPAPMPQGYPTPPHDARD